MWNFGKHRGKTTNETPSGYVDWTITRRLYRHRPDLRSALRVTGYLTPDTVTEDGGFDSQLWITPERARTYFQVQPDHMRDHTHVANGKWRFENMIECAREYPTVDADGLEGNISSFLTEIRRGRRVR